MRVRPTDGLHTASDLELELGSVWRIVFTKTCKQEIQQLDKAMASNLVKCFGVFAKGYPAKACRVGHDIRERTNFVKKLPIRDRTLLWSVRMLSVPDISPNAQRSYTYSQAIWIWAFPPNSDLEAMIRSIRNACEGFTDEFMDLCSAQNWIERRVLPLSITREEALVERRVLHAEANFPITASSNEQDLAKAYEVTPRVERALVKGFLSTVELPFVTSAEETALVHSTKSAFVIGRSGTVSFCRIS
jgi:hypothetical protein